MTVTSPKFVVKIPEENITKKIEHSAKQCADMEFREILCPYCGTPLVIIHHFISPSFLSVKYSNARFQIVLIFLEVSITPSFGTLLISRFITMPV